MIYLHKILPLLVSPLFLAIFLVLVGLVLKFRSIIFTGIFILLFCSLPVLTREMNSYLETGLALKQTMEVDEADAIVVLSGMLKVIHTKDEIHYEWNGSADRIFAGIELFQAKKSPKLILTNGILPWSLGKPEGEYLKKFAIKMGVPEEKIVLTKIVRNTDEEAKAVKKILQSDNSRIILVTSAFHMPRAKQIFEAVGLHVTSFPVDFLGGQTKLTVLDFIPSAGALNKTSFFIREVIGRTYYKFKYD